MLEVRRVYCGHEEGFRWFFIKVLVGRVSLDPHHLFVTKVSVVSKVVISCFKNRLYTDGSILFLAKIYKFLFLIECIPFLRV